MNDSLEFRRPIFRSWGCPIILFLLIGPIVLIFLFLSRMEKVRKPVYSEKLGFPRTLKPVGGKSVTILANPVRIVAANTGAADILSELIQPSRFAAIPVQVEDYAADPEFWKRNADIPRFEKFHAENILGYRPDLVISSAFQDSSAAAAIERQHVPILYLNDFESLDGIRGAITTIGDAVGRGAQAQVMISDFDSRLQTVANALHGTTQVPLVIYSNFGTGYTVGSGVCQDDIITRAGGLNVAAAKGLKGNAPITFEQLLRMDPEFIVVTGDDGLNSAQAKLLLNETLLQGLNAVKNRRIAVVHQRYFDALSQYAVRAVEELAQQLHPGIKW